MGRALRQVRAPPDLVVATKVCCYFDEELGADYVSYNPAAAECSVERSLKLLGRERLEIVYIHDTAYQSWDQMLRDGRIRPDLRVGMTPSQAGISLYHHEPHMERVEYQIWVDYGTTAPTYIGAYDGVPVIWLYARPGALR